MGPDLVMSQDTARVARVERISTTGRDPAIMILVMLPCPG